MARRRLRARVNLAGCDGRLIALWLYSFALGGATGGLLFGTVRSACYMPIFRWSGHGYLYPCLYAVYVNLFPFVYVPFLCLPAAIAFGLRRGLAKARRSERRCPVCAYAAETHCTECGWREGDHLKRRGGFAMATAIFFLAPVLVSIALELHFGRLDREFTAELAQARAMKPPAKLVHWRPWPWNETYVESLDDGSVRVMPD
jgi:hypothetical protein